MHPILRTRRGTAFAALLALAGIATATRDGGSATAGESIEVYTLNPDGTGKVAFELRGESPSFVAYTDNAPPADDTALAKEIWSAHNAFLQRFEALADVTAGTDENGALWLRGTGYFPRLPNPSGGLGYELWDDTYFVTAAVTAERGDDGTWTVGLPRGVYPRFPSPENDADNGENAESVKPAVDADRPLAEYIARHRPFWRAVFRHPRLGHVFDDVRRTVTWRYPARAMGHAGVEEVEDEGGAALRFVLDPAAYRERLRTAIEDDAWWAAWRAATGGRSTGVLADLSVALVQDETPPQATFPTEGVPPAFDYATEVAAARAHATPLTRMLRAGFVDAYMGPKGLVNLTAGASIPVAVKSSTYSRAYAGAEETALLLDPKAPPSDGPRAGSWSVHFVGAPIPANVLKVETFDSGKLLELVDGEGRDLLTDQSDFRRSLHVRLSDQRKDSFFDPAKGRLTKLPHISFSVGIPGTDESAPPRIGRIRGEVLFQTYAESVAVATDAFEPVPGAEARVGDENGGVEVKEIAEDRKSLLVRVMFPDETFQSVAVEDMTRPAAAPKDDAAATENEAPPTREPDRRIEPAGSGMFGSNRHYDARLTFAEPLPTSIRIVLRHYKGTRTIRVPFLAENIDLANPPALPDPLAGAPLVFAGRPADNVEALPQTALTVPADPAAPEDNRVPRLPAQQPMPVALYQLARQTYTPAPPVMKAMMGYDGDAGTRYDFQLLGSPVPSRAVAVKEVRLLRATAGDPARDIGRLAVHGHGELLRGRHNVTPPRGRDGLPPAPPMARLYFNGKSIPPDVERLATLEGRVTFRTFGTEGETPLGELTLAADATLDARHFRILELDGERKAIVCELDGEEDRIARLIFRDGETILSPNHGYAEYRERDEKGRIRFRLRFEQPLPEKVRVAAVDRAGLRDVVVPFRLENVNLLRPGPFPTAWPPFEGTFVGDEEDIQQGLADTLDELRRREADTVKNTPAPDNPPEVF